MPKRKAVVEPEPDLSIDIISIFGQKDMVDMDNDELKDRIIKLQEMRKIRVKKTKRKSALDLLLESLTVDSARQYLEQFDKQK